MLLCFDFDGVISDSLHQLYEIAKEAQKKTGEGRKPEINDFKTLEYLTFDHFARKIDIPENKVKTFSDNFFSILKSRNDKVSPFPGMIEIVKKLSSNNTIVIITANLKTSVEKMFAEFKALESISLILDEKDPGDKSDKIIYAMSYFHYKNSETFMIGDTISDIRYGKLANVRTIAVTWGFHSKELLSKENPDYIAESPEDLYNIIMEESKSSIINTD